MSNIERLKSILMESVQGTPRTGGDYFDLLSRSLTSKGVFVIEQQSLARAIAKSTRMGYNGSPEFYLRFAADIMEALMEERV